MDSHTDPSLKNAALLTIDVQNDFTLEGAVAEIDGTREAVPKIVRLLELFRKLDLPIFHIVRLYLADGSNVDLCRREAICDGQKIVAPNTPGADLVSELKPLDVELDAENLLHGLVQQIGHFEHVIYKPRWGAFYGTNLEEELHELYIDTLIVTGANFPNCPRTTIYEASERDFRIIVAEDAISGIYQRGVEELEEIGCWVLEVEDIVEMFAKV